MKNILIDKKKCHVILSFKKKYPKNAAKNGVISPENVIKVVEK